MSEIMKDKIREHTGDRRLKDGMYMIDVERETVEILKKIGYTPSKNIKKAFDKAWVNSDREDSLCDFIHKVWRFDS